MRLRKVKHQDLSPVTEACSTALSLIMRLWFCVVFLKEEPLKTVQVLGQVNLSLPLFLGSTPSKIHLFPHLQWRL